jgi:hypothetical protein
MWGREINGRNIAHTKDKKKGNYFLLKPDECSPMEGVVYSLDYFGKKQNLNFNIQI